MHNRKIFIVYPPNYVATYSENRILYKKFYSLGKAKKYARKLGIGAEICVNIQQHPGKFTRWNSSSLNYVGEIV